MHGHTYTCRRIKWSKPKARAHFIPLSRSAAIPLKDCLAYGEVKEPQQVGGGGGGEEEEAHIYEAADLQLPVRKDDGSYEPTDLQLPGATRGGEVDGVYEN